MELALKLPKGNPMDRQDIKWLKYIWDCSYENVVYLYDDKIPASLKQTRIYSCLLERLSFYRDSQKLLHDYEFDKENRCYYIVFESGFVTALNLIIDDINYYSYDPEPPIPHIQEKGKMIIKNTIINKGEFDGPVTNQIGDHNSNTQFQETQKRSGIKINFTAMFKALLKKIPFVKDFVE